MKTPIIKPWISRDEEPRNVYELLGFSWLDADRDALLAASESANEDLLNYQNIADAAKQRRALRLFEILGKFQAVLESAELLQQHDEQIIEELRGKCRQAFGADSTRWSQSLLLPWLLQQPIHPTSAARVLSRLLQVTPAAGAASAPPRVFGKPGAVPMSYLDTGTVDMSPATVSAGDIDSNTVDLSEFIGQPAAATDTYGLLPMDGGRLTPPVPPPPLPPVDPQRTSPDRSKRAKLPTVELERPRELPYAEPIIRPSGAFFMLVGAGVAGVLILLTLGGWWLMSTKRPVAVAPKAAESKTNPLENDEPAHIDKNGTNLKGPLAFQFQDPKQEVTLEQIKKDLADPNSDVRLKAVIGIRRLKPPPEIVFAALLSALASDNYAMALEARQTLASLGTPQDLDLVSNVLTEALKGKPLAPRQFAIETLARLANSAPPRRSDQAAGRQKLETALFIALADDDREIAKQAAAALQDKVPFARERRPDLMKALSSPHREIRLFAFTAVIRDSGESQQEAVATAVARGHSDVVREAVKNWKKLGAQGMPLVMLALRHADASIAQEAVGALQAEKLGRKRLDDLVEAQKSAHGFVRAHVIHALDWREFDANTAAGVLKPALQDRDRAVQTVALRSLTAALHDGQATTRTTAFACLQALEKHIPNAEQMFFAALEDDNATIRAQAFAAVRRYPASAKKLASRLRSMLGKSEAQTKAATLSLLELKADSELRDFITSSDREVAEWTWVCKALLQNYPKHGLLNDALSPKFKILEEVKSGPMRGDSVRALAQLGVAVVPKLLPLFDKGNSDYKRVGAASVLGEIGPDVQNSPDGRKAMERLRALRDEVRNPILLEELQKAQRRIESPDMN